MFGDIGIEKNRFYRNKSHIFKKDVVNQKVSVSNKISYLVNLYTWIGYLHNLFNDL